MPNQPQALKRRTFIKGTSATLLFTTLPSYAFQFFADEQPKKVALIGTGWYGTGDLLRLIQIANIEVVSLCDVDKNQLNTAAQLVAERQKNGKKTATIH